MEWLFILYTTVLASLSGLILFLVNRRGQNTGSEPEDMLLDLRERTNSVYDNASAPMVVWQIYYRILNDEELAPYFNTVNTAKVVNHQVEMFKAIAANQVPPYTQQHLKDVHIPLGVTNDHFSKLLRVILDVYMYYGISSDISSYVLGTLETYRPFIVKAE